MGIPKQEETHWPIARVVKHFLEVERYVPKDEHWGEVIRGDHTHESVSLEMMELGIKVVYHSEYRVSDETAEVIQIARDFIEDPDKKADELEDEELIKSWTEDYWRMLELCRQSGALAVDLGGKVGINLYEARFDDSRLAWYVIDPKYKQFMDLVGELEALVKIWEEIWGEIEEGKEEREKAKLQASVDALESDVKFRTFKTQAEQIAYAINTIPGLNEIEHSEASKMIKALITRLKVEGK